MRTLSPAVIREGRDAQVARHGGAGTEGGVSGKFWSPDELAAIRQHYPVSAWSTILRHLPGRTKASVRCMAISLGIKKLKNSRTPWTGTERMKLRELYPRHRWEEIEAALPRHPKPAIAKQASMMKLRRDCARRESRYSLMRELRRIRRHRCITQAALANRIGIHAVQLAKWERGEQMPRMQGLHDWAQALGLKIALQGAA